MQPYREAAEETRRQGERPLNAAKNIVGTAATAYLGGGAINKVLPFLSKYIPEALAIKGLNKIDPRYGKFINTALAAGQTFDAAKDFMGEKIEESQEPAKQEGNIIEQVSPELHQFISDQIKQGREGYAAGAIAQKDKRFAPVIEKLIKEHKMSWADIIEQIYGQGAPLKKKGMMQQEADRFSQAYPQEQGTGAAPEQAPNLSGQQQGPGMQAISAVLNKINQKLGG